MPHAAARMATRDRDAGRYQRHRPEKLCSMGSSTSITRRSRLILRSRAVNCPAMCNASSRITSNVVGWTMAFCGYVARVVMLSTWFPSVANAAVSAPVAGRDAWPTSAWMHEVEQCRSNCRERGLARRWSLARAAGAPVGLERPISFALPTALLPRT
jgi:hypothetical protein